MKKIRITADQSAFFARLADYFAGVPPQCIEPHSSTRDSVWSIGKNFPLSIPAHLYNYAAKIEDHNPDCLPKSLLERHIDEWHENWNSHDIGEAWFMHRLIALGFDQESRDKIDILISKFGKVDKKAYWGSTMHWRHHPHEVFMRLTCMPLIKS